MGKEVCVFTNTGFCAKYDENLSILNLQMMVGGDRCCSRVIVDTNEVIFDEAKPVALRLDADKTYLCGLDGKESMRQTLLTGAEVADAVHEFERLDTRRLPDVQMDVDDVCEIEYS